MDTPLGSILDVPGVSLGHHQRLGPGWQSGSTVVAVAGGATPGVDVRGGGPGTRETDALRPETLVQHIHAVTLTGGSAFGLAAADGVVGLLEQRGLGFPIADHVVPVVPAAVIFDLGRGGDFDRRPDASFGERAARSALAGRRRPAWGSVGAGAGARAGGLQGGVGTASTVVRIGDTEIVVGAVAVVNANGTAIDPDTGLPWERHGLRLARPSARERNAVRAALTGHAAAALNTTIGVVATSAALDKAECSKVASVAHDGLARAIRPAHSMTDGDTVFVLATGADELPAHHFPANHHSAAPPQPTPERPSRIAAINQILSAGADAFSAACTHAVIAATTVGEVPAWRDLCPNTLAAC